MTTVGLLAQMLLTEPQRRRKKHGGQNKLPDEVRRANEKARRDEYYRKNREVLIAKQLVRDKKNKDHRNTLRRKRRLLKGQQE